MDGGIGRGLSTTQGGCEFAYDEKRVFMERLLEDLRANREGFENLHGEILRDGKSFGNLTGDHPHDAWFGKTMPATPDGRYGGDAFSAGSGQNDGKDREGITALFKSVAKMAPRCLT